MSYDLKQVEAAARDLENRLGITLKQVTKPSGDVYFWNNAAALTVPGSICVSGDGLAYDAAVVDLGPFAVNNFSVRQNEFTTGGRYSVDNFVNTLKQHGLA